ncbi:hypothetical protein SAMN05660845_2111 [Flavobacterium swingsii]|jgi:hypothetical protein|uniref:Uncharacterized protein n=1 Tax=Flavobacterium swingsii TaxID=498292 RepID=A0A1I0ZCL7_9FLAO|nr:outer membrane beta-barrel protein [Flavobacterium swingsii]SFB22158.1 hypothetical protein SAMN05660845_2111 [Flavobacterium swingsii]
MKKVLLTAIAVFGFTVANAQSNKQGTMHVNVLGGFLSGTATQQDDAAGSLKYKSTATGAQFGANFQYGIAESFSAGIGLELGTSVLTPKSINIYDEDYDFGSNYNTTVSTFKVNLSGRYYFVNKDNFNVFAGPSIGYTTAKDKTAVLGVTISDDKTKYAGLNYGVNVGGNYYFSDVVGVILNVGYEGSSLTSKYTYTDYNDDDVLVSYTDKGKATIGGIKVMAGLALKF